MAIAAKKKPAAAASDEHLTDNVYMIAVDNLQPSELNVRKTGGQSIAELAASIRANGLLQNLTVTPAERGKGRRAGKYGIIAGNRRFRAIQQLISEGHLPADYQVLCRVTVHEQAISASLAENIVREAMNPADQVEAFMALAAQGRSVADIADSFGVSEVTVQRRLRLANVAPLLLAEYRAGNLSLDKLQAFALTDDHSVQLAVWEQANPWTDAASIKDMIAQDEVDSDDDPRALFVGVAAYEAAGGAVRRDLFSEEGQFYLSDSGLLERMTAEKLRREADALQAKEQLPWVDVHVRWDWEARNAYRQCKTAERDPTAAEAFTLKKRRAALEKISREQDNLTDEGEHDAADALEFKRRALEQEIEELEAALHFPVGPEAGRAGAVLTIGVTGQLEVRRHLLREEAEEDEEGAGEDDDLGDEDPDAEDKAPAPAPAAGLPRALVQRLTAHRTAAVQASLATLTHRALCVLVAHMANAIWGDGSGPLQMIVRPANPFRHGDDVQESRASAELAKAEEAITDLLPHAGGGDAEELLDWLLEQDANQVLQILAVCTAVQIDLTTEHPQGWTHADYLLRISRVDMADWWQPTRATFFDHLPRAQIEGVIATAGGAEQAQELAKLKGKEVVAGRAEQMLAGKGWLPEVLRGGE